MSIRQIIVLLRWTGAVWVEFLALKLLITAAHASPYADVRWQAIKGLALLLFGGALVGPEIITLVSSPVHSFINGLLFPNDSDPPPVDYTLARFYRRKSRFEDSIEAYLKIISYHPQEFAAYAEGIETAFQSGMPETALKIRRLGARKLRSRDERRNLEQAFEIASRAVYRDPED